MTINGAKPIENIVKRAPTSTSWKPGQSGNPRGAAVKKRIPRSEVMGRTAKQQAEKHVRKAFKLLSDCVQDREAPMASRVNAAAQILDRAYGKAPQDVNLRGSIETHIIALLKSIDNQDVKPIEAGELEVLPGTSDKGSNVAPSGEDTQDH